jgi:hypothetical protein
VIGTGSYNLISIFLNNLKNLLAISRWGYFTKKNVSLNN